MCTYSGRVFGLSTQSTVLNVIGRNNNESVESPTRMTTEKRSPDLEYKPRSQEVAPKVLTGSMFDIKETVKLIFILPFTL